MATRIDRDHADLALDEVMGERGGPPPEPLVGLLERDDIRLESGHNPRGPMRIAAPVETDAFAYVPCRDAQLHRRSFLMAAD